MPNDSPKAAGPQKPTELKARSWWATLKRSFRHMKENGLTDWAASLTYYSLLALFPALIVLVALVGVFGEYPRTTNALLDIVDRLGPQSTVDNLREPIEGVVRSKGGAGALLGIGLLGALWSASGYIGAFIRASNTIYGVDEGRRFWKLRPLQVGVTLGMVLVAALVAIAIVMTGGVAEAVGDQIGVGSTAVTIWNIAKWPVLVAIAIVGISTLYYLSPNVRMHGFRWVTPGALVALAVWVIASMGFGFYAANFGSYNETYGTLGGIVIFLVWLWITNLAVLFGAQFDAELERSREIEHGVPGAHDAIQLPVRDMKKPRGGNKRSA
jgi:membrane protein